MDAPLYFVEISEAGAASDYDASVVVVIKISVKLCHEFYAAALCNAFLSCSRKPENGHAVDLRDITVRFPVRFALRHHFIWRSVGLDVMKRSIICAEEAGEGADVTQNDFAHFLRIEGHITTTKACEIG